MNVTEIIDQITTTECVNCRFGKCLIALKALRDETQSNPPSQPVTQRNTAKQGKLQRKTVKEPAIKNSQRAVAHDNTDIVLNYVAAHPGSGIKEIVAGTGFDRNLVKYHLTKARKEGRVKCEGRSQFARWSMAKPGNNITENRQAAPASEGEFYVCPHCPKKFRNLLDFQQHKAKHGEA